MKAKITNSKISKLKDNEIFVFGSNLAGNHAGGAAKLAYDKFGAEMKKGIGLFGNSYALPTLDASLNKLTLDEIQDQVNILEKLIKQRTDLHFHITAIGTGIAGFTVEEIAPMFAGFQEYENCSLPQEFIDLLGEEVIHGFKAINIRPDKTMHCRNHEYKVGSAYYSARVSICNYGYHFCQKIVDTLEYYSRNDETVYCKVIGCGKFESDEKKHCVSVLKIVELYLHTDKDFNSGSRNSGDGNSGDWNSGNWNSGDWNSGSRNSGSRNSGSRNSGNWNSGNWNSGNWNSGNWNSGSRNSGSRNSGDWNSGDWNSGDWNSGLFNTTEPKLRIFNKETNKKKSELYFPNWLNFELIKWVNSESLTDEQKAQFPHHETCGGILITSEYKQAAQDSYNAATKEEQRSVEDLPNYDAEILFEIFGIDRRKK